MVSKPYSFMCFQTSRRQTTMESAITYNSRLIRKVLELQVDTKKRCLYSGRIGLQFQSTKQLNYEIISRLFSKSISFLIKFSFRLLLNGRQLCRTLVESLIISLNPNAKIGSISVTIWIHTSFIMCLWCQIDTWIMPSSRVLEAWHTQFITPSNYCVKTPETACAVFPLPTVQFTRFEWLDRSNSIVRTHVFT